jgi:hypothetical protein
MEDLADELPQQSEPRVGPVLRLGERVFEQPVGQRGTVNVRCASA